MKKVIAVIVALALTIMPTAVVSAALAEDLDYNDTEYSFDVTTDKEYPGYWRQDERCAWVVTYAPRIKKVVTGAKTTKVTADVTTSARVVMISWYDGKSWSKPKAYSNFPCNGSIIARNDSQIKLYKNGSYSSWLKITVTQKGRELYSIKKYHPNDLNASYALAIDDFLLEQIRKTVARERTFTIPCKAKKIKIRCVYTGMNGNSYSRWIPYNVWR